MTEDESRRLEDEEPEDEVEAHKRLAGATEEPGDDGDDDIEAHRHLKA